MPVKKRLAVVHVEHTKKGLSVRTKSVKKKKNRSRKQYSLERAYNKAVAKVNELESKGYHFSKATKKAISKGSFNKKYKNVSQRDIDYYKSLSKTSIAKSKATSFSYEDRQGVTHKLSTEQGERYLRHQTYVHKKEQRIASQLSHNMNNLKEVKMMVEGIPEGEEFEYKGRKFSVDYSEGVSEILNSIESLEELGIGISDESVGRIISQLDRLEHFYHQDQVDNILTTVNGTVSSYFREGDDSTLIPVVDETLDLTGTMYEDLEQDTHNYNAPSSLSFRMGMHYSETYSGKRLKKLKKD